MLRMDINRRLFPKFLMVEAERKESRVKSSMQLQHYLARFNSLELLANYLAGCGSKGKEIGLRTSRGRKGLK
ncbi:hypothetical protein HanPSC8_Chr17g0777491 [Helianthus annuus]|nr:hypothetical protein HanPSC8_Chr17g0777491 [Helianthus annuus]